MEAELVSRTNISSSQEQRTSCSSRSNVSHRLPVLCGEAGCGCAALRLSHRSTSRTSCQTGMRYWSSRPSGQRRSSSASQQSDSLATQSRVSSSRGLERISTKDRSLNDSSQRVRNSASNQTTFNGSNQNHSFLTSPQLSSTRRSERSPASQRTVSVASQRVSNSASQQTITYPSNQNRSFLTPPQFSSTTRLEGSPNSQRTLSGASQRVCTSTRQQSGYHTSQHDRNFDNPSQLSSTRRLEHSPTTQQTLSDASQRVCSSTSHQSGSYASHQGRYLSTTPQLSSRRLERSPVSEGAFASHRVGRPTSKQGRSISPLQFNDTNQYKPSPGSQIGWSLARQRAWSFAILHGRSTKQQGCMLKRQGSCRLTCKRKRHITNRQVLRSSSSKVRPSHPGERPCRSRGSQRNSVTSQRLYNLTSVTRGRRIDSQQMRIPVTEKHVHIIDKQRAHSSAGQQTQSLDRQRTHSLSEQRINSSTRQPACNLVGQQALNLAEQATCNAPGKNALNRVGLSTGQCTHNPTEVRASYFLDERLQRPISEGGRGSDNQREFSAVDCEEVQQNRRSSSQQRRGPVNPHKSSPTRQYVFSPRQNMMPRTMAYDNMNNNANLIHLVEAIQSIGSNIDRLSYQNGIPEFDPANTEQTVDMWLYKVNECALIYSWTDKQITYFAFSKLKGLAQKWYQGLATLMYTWPEWQDKLKLAFRSDDNYGQLLTNMLNKRARVQDSLEEYFYDKLALLNCCGIQDKKAVDCIILGIDDRCVRLGAKARFDSPDQLLSYLKCIRKADNAL